MDSNTLSAFAAILSVIAVSLSAALTYRQGRRSRLERAEDLATRFREPLLQAASNLASRLYNIARKDFLGRFLTHGEASQQERDYAVRNTCYLFGQYLAWVEIIRRESQYVDPRSRENNRLIVERLEQVRDRMADSEDVADRPLRLFRGEQRAVAELMLVPVATPVGDVPRWECLGYAAFVERLTSEPRFATWFESLEEAIGTLAKEAPVLPPRITELQHALIDLMHVLDPKCERVPATFRGKL